MKKEKIKFLILIFWILVTFFSYSCSQNDKKVIEMSLLTADSSKYWDPYYGFSSKKLGRGWVLNQDKSFIEYTYDENGNRKRLDYGDLIWDTFTFELDYDTFKIINYNNYEFEIIKVSKDSLIMKDISRMRYTYLDTFLLIRSDDQKTKLD